MQIAEAGSRRIAVILDTIPVVLYPYLVHHHHHHHTMCVIITPCASSHHVHHHHTMQEIPRSVSLYNCQYAELQICINRAINTTYNRNAVLGHRYCRINSCQFFGNLPPHPSASILTTAVSCSQPHINQVPVSAVYALRVCIPRCSSLARECEFSLNQARSLSYSYVSPNQTCLPYMFRFNPVPQPPHA